ncbi:MAG TPA: tRNA (adenosine(37)-N6)-threonylcarbamoyltransferase complex ATPase subunit type 1 TsaE [Polyangiales bacterium]
MPSELVLELPHRRATRRLAALIGAALSPGDLVVLEGDLGAGKTFLVRGIARALGVPSRVRVTSPTFALINELSARAPLLHADLYRLGSADELAELGLTERIGRDAIVLVEWGERFAEELGGEGLFVFLSLVPGGRVARLEARGEKGRALLAKIVESGGAESLPSRISRPAGRLR